MLESGFWLMARDLRGSGDAADDVVQVYVPQKLVLFCWTNFLLTPCLRSRIPLTLLADLEKARDNALGPRSMRGSLRGDLPVERFENGSIIRSVGSSARCYPLGLTWEKQTGYCAPNANVKMFNGGVDRNTMYRADLLKVSHMI